MPISGGGSFGWSKNNLLGISASRVELKNRLSAPESIHQEIEPIWLRRFGCTGSGCHQSCKTVGEFLSMSQDTGV